jgi:hypothetical protein
MRKKRDIIHDKEIDLDESESGPTAVDPGDDVDFDLEDPVVPVEALPPNTLLEEVDEAADDRPGLEERLTRIEDKLDRILAVLDRGKRK